MRLIDPLPATSHAKAKADAARTNAEQEQDKADERVSSLQKQLKVAGSQTAALFRVHFETAQDAMSKMMGLILELDDRDAEREKLSAALRALCNKVLESVLETGR